VFHSRVLKLLVGCQEGPVARRKPAAAVRKVSALESRPNVELLWLSRAVKQKHEAAAATIIV